MNHFKLSFFIVTMSINMCAMAADNNGNSIRIDRNLDSSNSSESMKMRDCIDKSGNDKAACEKEMANDRAGIMPNQNSRLNRNRNRQIREDRNSNELNSINTQSEDRLYKDKQTNDMNSKDSTKEKIKPSDSNPAPTSQDRINRSGTSNAM